MRVLHVNNTGGVAATLALEQRKLGLDADVLVFRKDLSGFSYNINLDVDRFPRLFQPVYRAWRLSKDFLNYDVYHFHSSSFVTGYIDAPFLQSIGKKIVHHHHGSDIRDKGKPFFSRFCNLRLISTPDLFDWAPDALWLPNPVFIHKSKPKLKRKKPLVVHAPRQKNVHRKTIFIERVLIKLAEKDLIDYKILPYLSHGEFMEALKNSDIFVDNLGGGWYGVSGLEAMCFGVPVCVYIREDLEKFTDLNAFCNSNEQTLENYLERLVTSDKFWIEKSVLGRKYVERVHDSKKVAELTKKYYEKLFE